ncbi:MAG TPA: glycosyltransferase family 4 protein [Thermoanaerobaculia bacterium]|jgi:glycosyltransferase involved in cell wall biosynthesis
MAAESVIVVCPDTNVRLWPGRTDEAATGGGKTAILRLADAWARAGHPVTVAAGAVRTESAEGVTIASMSEAAGEYDVAIYVTGSYGHFRDPEVDAIRAARRLFWQNGPGRAELPPGRVDWYVAPAKFLARRAVDEWGHPPEKVVVIPGEAVRRRRAASEAASRDPFAAIYASHPFKGLREAVEVLGHLRAEFPGVRLDVYGSERLWADGAAASAERVLPEWVRRAGETPQSEVERRMADYGLMLYLTEWVDGFSLSTAEALAAGVIVIATAHGANAEFLRHGWNGFLVRSDGGRPDLLEAQSLVRAYLRDPAAFAGIRANAMASVPTWDEQAEEWRRLWRSPLRGA